MRLLIVHTGRWSNLGSVVQTAVLLEALREVAPSQLDLNCPPAALRGLPTSISTLVDGCVVDQPPRYWSYLPPVLRRGVAEPVWRRKRRALFSEYDAIISAPGAFLVEDDPLLTAALCDIEVAAELRMPLVLASHSIGPLSAVMRDRLARARLCVARENTSHMYLSTHDITSIAGADLGFLYPYETHLYGGVRSIAQPYRLLFLKTEGSAPEDPGAYEGELHRTAQNVGRSTNERIILASTDAERDTRALVKLGRRLGHPVVLCRSVPALVHLIAGSSGVTSDCYYPAVCAAALGKPVEVLVTRQPHKMLGLQGLLGTHDLGELKRLAQVGLNAVCSAVASVRNER